MGHDSHVKRSIPILLTTFRLLLGPAALATAWREAPRILFLPILVTGMLSDVFDGILARRFKVSTPRLRRYDSVTDVLYYLFLLGCVWRLSNRTLMRTGWAIALMALSELACIGVSLVRFRQYPATHTYLAKLYGLLLTAGFFALLVFGAGGWVVIAVALIAIATNAEIIAIHFIVQAPPVDIPSIFQLPGRLTSSTR